MRTQSAIQIVHPRDISYSGCLAGSKADAGGDAAKALVGEAVAVVAKLAGQGSLLGRSRLAVGDLACQGRVVQLAVPSRRRGDDRLRRRIGADFVRCLR